MPHFPKEVIEPMSRLAANRKSIIAILALTACGPTGLTTEDGGPSRVCITNAVVDTDTGRITYTPGIPNSFGSDASCTTFPQVPANCPHFVGLDGGVLGVRGFNECDIGACPNIFSSLPDGGRCASTILRSTGVTGTFQVVMTANADCLDGGPEPSRLVVSYGLGNGRLCPSQPATATTATPARTDSGASR